MDFKLIQSMRGGEANGLMSQIMPDLARESDLKLLGPGRPRVGQSGTDGKSLEHRSRARKAGPDGSFLGVCAFRSMPCAGISLTSMISARCG